MPPWRRLSAAQSEVVRIALLVGVDEHQIERAARRELGQDVARHADVNAGARRETGAAEALARDLGVLLRQLDRVQLAVGLHAAQQRDARVAAQRPDLDGLAARRRRARAPPGAGRPAPRPGCRAARPPRSARGSPPAPRPRARTRARRNLTASRSRCRTACSCLRPSLDGIGASTATRTSRARSPPRPARATAPAAGAGGGPPPARALARSGRLSSASRAGSDSLASSVTANAASGRSSTVPSARAARTRYSPGSSVSSNSTVCRASASPACAAGREPARLAARLHHLRGADRPRPARARACRRR